MIGEKRVTFQGITLREYTKNTVIVGTGAAGYNAADRLYAYGQKDIAIVTEGINQGTSRNTGSDKQTYYKLTLSGGDPDSVREMAETLFEGRCVDGDIALCEAALSAQGFLRLAELGVPFPRNRWGEYIGYKTDHDPRRRATSVGPYTSKKMTECLQASVEAKGIPVFDGLLVIRILVDHEVVQGLLCLDLNHLEEENMRYVAFRCGNVIWATGGPAGMYQNSVYPTGHFGSTGTAFAAGVMGRNLTEWQYGLASVRPRWNVSGTYMQVLPRFISTKEDGSDEREFLFDFFEEQSELLSKVFLKGYQWPFDVRKVNGGSSIIDILVYMETKKGRKVYLDFRTNPGGEMPEFEAMSDEAYQYLKQAGACFGTPYERLMHMNQPAVDFYLDKGVDLAKEPLEIALCAQHNNGGLAVDAWWQTNVKGFFAAGEVAGSHGVYRPGGSALNAGQVGSTRAAQYVWAYGAEADNACVGYEHALETALLEAVALTKAAVKPISNDSRITVAKIWTEAAVDMSNYGAAIRSESMVHNLIARVKEKRQALIEGIYKASVSQLPLLFRLRDMLLCQQIYLEAMKNYLETGGRSRGSALYTDLSGIHPYELLPVEFTYQLEAPESENRIQEVAWDGNQVHFIWRSAHLIPEDDDFFENVWRSFRENGNVY